MEKASSSGLFARGRTIYWPYNEINPLIERTTNVDTNDYDLALADAIMLDADQPEDISFGREVTKTLIVSTATSAAVFGGIVVIPMAIAAVSRWFARKKNADVVDGEVISTTDVPSQKA